MNLGVAIRKIRNDKNISQSELSIKSGISQTSISQIENGSKQPTKKTLGKICLALSVPESLLYFYGIEEVDIPKSKKDVYKVIYPVIEEMIKKLIID